jgi:hypothetical protein
MGHALGVVVLHLLAVASAGSEQDLSAGHPPADGGPPPSQRAIMVNLRPLEKGTVRRALDLALAMLASPQCSEVYSEFRRPDGRTPQDELERMGIGPEELLERLVFTDGSREPVCRQGLAVMAATPGRSLILVCPSFADFQFHNPRLSAAIVIHESLHALGLGENPPSSSEITRRVERRCRTGSRRPRGPTGPPEPSRRRRSLL